MALPTREDFQRLEAALAVMTAAITSKFDELIELQRGGES